MKKHKQVNLEPYPLRHDYKPVSLERKPLRQTAKHVNLERYYKGIPTLHQDPKQGIQFFQLTILVSIFGSENQSIFPVSPKSL